MRKAIILALLLLSMQSILPLGAGLGNQSSLLTFGFLILAAFTAGEVAVSMRLPQIVGYIVAGVLFGPYALDTVTTQVIASLAPVSRLGIALIAFLAGAELQIDEIRKRGRTILKIMTAELGLTFLLIAASLVALRPFIPFLATVPQRELIALVLIFAAMAVVHSPAVTMAMLTETRASGAVARTTLGVVLFADVVVVLLFAIVMAVARALAPPTEFVLTPGVGMVIWEVLGALLVGAALGVGTGLALRFMQREIFIFAIVVAFLGAEIAKVTHVEGLLTLLVAGFVTENFFKGGTALRHAMERSAVPIFVAFFALAGAQIAISDLAALWPVVLPIVLVRMLGLYLGTRIGARWAGAEPLVQRYSWLGLVSQAGVAIGLATIVAEVYPLRGGQMRTLFLGVLAINQVAGPILFRRALDRSGELVAEPERKAPALAV